MSPTGRLRIGLRREVLILLPVSMLVLVLLSTFTVFSYRSAIVLLAEARREEAALTARKLAEVAASVDRLSASALRPHAPGAQRIAVLDPRGRVIDATGPFEEERLLEPLAGVDPATNPAVGPSADLPDRVAGFAAFQRSGQRLTLRVDLPAREIARQLDTLRTLSWVVLPLNLLLAILVLLFLRHLMAPYESLLSTAQRAVGADGQEDEVSFLLSTFERAMAALAQSGAAEAAPEPGDDIAALQRALAPSLESGLLLLDRQGGVLSLNPLGASLLEVDPPVPGTPVETALERHPRLVEILRQAIDDGAGQQRQEAIVETTAGQRTLGLTVHALRRDDGTVRGFLVLFVDLTEARRAAEEQRLADGLQQLGELAAGLAHELRNSLATLRGYLKLVERGPDEESITDYLAEIHRESDHLARVVEDFLAFARPETARVGEVDLLGLARRAAGDPALEGKPVDLPAPPVEAPRIRGDEQLIERALRNLLRNAAEAERRAGIEGPLAIGLQRTAAGIELTIDDRGAGVPREVRERLFQPFVTGRSDGVGLGLALTHRIVTLHGGRLRLEDRPRGGTRATLLFPPDTFVT